MSNAYALLSAFSLRMGRGSLESSSRAPINLKYIRLMESSTCQYIKRLRSCGASADAARGCSLKYLSFLSGSKLSRNSVSSAVIDCTAPRFPPLARARSTSPSKFSNAFKFATGSSVTLNTFAATLSLAVPLVRTISNHLAFASLLRCNRFAYEPTRSSNALFAIFSFASSSPLDGDFVFVFAAPSSAFSAFTVSYHAPPDAPAPSRARPPFASPPLSSFVGIGPAPGFHGRFFPDARLASAASPSSPSETFPRPRLASVAVSVASPPSRASVDAFFARFPRTRLFPSASSPARVVFVVPAAARAFRRTCSARKSRSSNPRATSPDAALGANPSVEANALTSAPRSASTSDAAGIARASR